MSKKNSAKQDSSPAAGRVSDRIPIRRRAIRAERLLSYDNKMRSSRKHRRCGIANGAGELQRLNAKAAA